jgi:hypothetical protein
VMMQCELDFLSVSAFTVTLREGGRTREIPVTVPDTERILAVVRRQMGQRQLDLENKVGSRTIKELTDEIQRSARALGLEVDAPAPGVLEDDGGRILPVELMDIHAGGGDITDPGQKKNGGAR